MYYDHDAPEKVSAEKQILIITPIILNPVAVMVVL
jgi:hypothetical protein